MYKKIICIKSFETTFCKFEENKIYILTDNIGCEDFPLLLTTGNKNTYAFHPNSSFKTKIFPNYFIDIQEQRKLKLEKINEKR